MEPLIKAAARALAIGDPLGALNYVALRDDAPALALRGIAMAQLGDLARARVLVRSAARAFGAKEPMAHARCVVAEAEIALASRELNWPAAKLDAARATLAAHGDHINAAHAQCLDIRRLLLTGHLDEAERALATVDRVRLPPALTTVCELINAGIALRRLQTRAARAALGVAKQAARRAGIPALIAEVEHTAHILDAPAARLLARGEQRPLLLEDVEAVYASKDIIVDTCCFVVRCESQIFPLATRPVLFALARALGEAWPQDVSRDALVAKIFRLKLADESHRARLRVEIGRLRAILKPIVDINATPRGFIMSPCNGREIAVLLRPVEEKYAALLALLADGEAWSSSALAVALGANTRTVQRALEALAAAGKIQALGRGRAQRWMTPPVPGFTTILLLTAPLPTN